MKPINFIPGDIVLAKLTEIKEERGITSVTEAIRYCILEAYKKEFPDYIKVQKDRNKLDPKEKAIIKADAQIEAEVRREKAREQREYDHQVAICSIMDGTVVPHPENGLPSCRYIQYTQPHPKKVDRQVMYAHIGVLNDETPSQQYQSTFKMGDEAKAVITELLSKKETIVTDYGK